MHKVRQKLDAEKWARRVMLRQIIAMAGYPDAVQACRNIIQHCEKMLGNSNSQIDEPKAEAIADWNQSVDEYLDNICNK